MNKLLIILGSILTLVVLIGAVLCFVLAVGSFNEEEYPYALGFTILILIIPVAWLSLGLFLLVRGIIALKEAPATPAEDPPTFRPRTKDQIEIVELNIECPECKRKDMVAIDVGKDLSLVCCSNRSCKVFGKAVNIQTI